MLFLLLLPRPVPASLAARCDSVGSRRASGDATANCPSRRRASSNTTFIRKPHLGQAKKPFVTTLLWKAGWPSSPVITVWSLHRPQTGTSNYLLAVSSHQTCIHRCICVYASLYLCICSYVLCLCMYGFVYMHLCICVYASMYLRSFTCVHSSVHVCITACTCMYA